MHAMLSFQRHSSSGTKALTGFYLCSALRGNVIRGGPGCLNSLSASISGASAGVRLPCGGDKASGAMVRCSRDDASGRLLELPIWMFDRASCALIEVVAAPRVDLTALSALIALLRETERADGASSNARLSGAAMGTHNPNRGETHATVDERPSRSSRRTAAIRPVRVGERRRHEEDARMARPSCGDAPDPDPSHGAPDPRTRGRRLRSTSGGNAP